MDGAPERRGIGRRRFLTDAAAAGLMLGEFRRADAKGELEQGPPGRFMRPVEEGEFVDRWKKMRAWIAEDKAALDRCIAGGDCTEATRRMKEIVREALSQKSPWAQIGHLNRSLNAIVGQQTAAQLDSKTRSSPSGIRRSTFSERRTIARGRR